MAASSRPSVQKCLYSKSSDKSPRNVALIMICTNTRDLAKSWKSYIICWKWGTLQLEISQILKSYKPTKGRHSRRFKRSFWRSLSIFREIRRSLFCIICLRRQTLATNQRWWVKICSLWREKRFWPKSVSSHAEIAKSPNLLKFFKNLRKISLRRKPICPELSLV